MLSKVLNPTFLPFFKTKRKKFLRLRFMTEILRQPNQGFPLPFQTDFLTRLQSFQFVCFLLLRHRNKKQSNTNLLWCFCNAGHFFFTTFSICFVQWCLTMLFFKHNFNIMKRQQTNSKSVRSFKDKPTERIVKNPRLKHQNERK